MTVGSAVAAGSMAVARRLRAGRAGGVIVTQHVASALQTRAQVNALRRWFDFIHHDELLDRLERPGRRPFCLLTFDDGKRSIATQTAPELERLGVPAVFYVTTGFLTDGSPLWFDRREAIIKSLGHVPPGLEIDDLKRLSLEVIHDRLDRACAGHRLVLDLTSDDVLPMSWDDARALARRGFTIAAHGVHHCVLTRETETRAFCEIRQSIEDVTSRIGVPCASFAFPNGNYTPRLARHALECGVRTVMTTEPAWADGRYPCWRLPRVELFGRDTTLKVALKLSAAATGRLLANPDGTGRRYWRTDRFGRHDATSLP